MIYRGCSRRRLIRNISGNPIRISAGRSGRCRNGNGTREAGILDQRIVRGLPPADPYFRSVRHRLSLGIIRFSVGVAISTTKLAQTINILQRSYLSNHAISSYTNLQKSALHLQFFALSINKPECLCTNRLCPAKSFQ